MSCTLLEQLRQEGQQRALVKSLKARTVLMPDYENCVISPRGHADVIRLMPAMLSAHTAVIPSRRRASYSVTEGSGSSYSREISGNSQQSQTDYYNVSGATEPRSWPLVRPARPLSHSLTRSRTVDGSFGDNQSGYVVGVESDVKADSDSNKGVSRPRSMSAIAAAIQGGRHRTVGRSLSLQEGQLVPLTVPYSVTVSAVAEAVSEEAINSATTVFDANIFAQLHNEMIADSVCVTLTTSKELHHSLAVVDIDGAV